jgi:pimeloyl-ACP methyl ester carboxylesterase
MATPSSPPNSPDTIVLIHGLWMTPRSWEHWKERYEGQGYKVLAPAWPGLEVEVEELRADPTPLTKLSGKQVIDNYDSIIRELDSPPIIMGHSLGGAVTQVLLDRGLGAAAAGVAPATVKGIRDLPLSTLRASGHILGRPFNRGNATPSSRKQFKYGFANTMTQQESDAIYDRYYVPSANRVLYDIALSNLSRNAPTEVDFNKSDRAPLLMIAFEHDHVVPPKPIRHNASKYKAGTVAYTEFPGRPHFPGAPGWEEVADYALSWAVEHAAAGRHAESAPSA